MSDTPVAIDEIQLLRALADETRLRVLALLSREELAVAELTSILKLSQSTVSGHLATLRGAGLVRSRRLGRTSRYALVRGPATAGWLALLAGRLELDPIDEAALKRALRTRRESEAQELDRLSRSIGKGVQPGRSWEALARALLALLPPQSVIDVGVGRGELSLLLARGAARFTALDVNESVLERFARRAQALGVTVETLCQDAHEADLPPASCDLLLFSQSLHHFEEPARALAACAPALKPGGRLLILDLLAHNERWVEERLGHLHRGFSREQLEGWVQAAGLSVVRWELVHRTARAPHLQTVMLLAAQLAP